MRRFAKSLISYLVVAVMLPIWILYFLEVLLLGKRKAFADTSQLVSLFPGVIGCFVRRGFYLCTLKSCSIDSEITFGTFFPEADVEIGDHVYIGAKCIISQSAIARDVMIGSNVSVISGGKTHNFDSIDIPMRLQGSSAKKILIGEDAWIGNNCVIMANIGKKCVIGAGSVVTKDVGDYCVAVGNPAKVVRNRLDSQKVA